MFLQILKSDKSSSFFKNVLLSKIYSILYYLVVVYQGSMDKFVCKTIFWKTCFQKRTVYEHFPYSLFISRSKKVSPKMVSIRLLWKSTKSYADDLYNKKIFFLTLFGFSWLDQKFFPKWKRGIKEMSFHTPNTTTV